MLKFGGANGQGSNIQGLARRQRALAQTEKEFCAEYAPPGTEFRLQRYDAERASREGRKRRNETGRKDVLDQPFAFTIRCALLTTCNSHFLGVLRALFA
jgi:hypothetical protein